MQSVGEYALSIGVFIAVWWLYVELKHVPAYILPAPPKVFKSLVEMFVKRSVYAHLWTTSYEVVLGFLIGGFLGVLFGYVFVKMNALKTMLMPYLIFCRRRRRLHSFLFLSCGLGLGSSQRWY